MSQAYYSFIKYWIAALAFLVFSMVVIGGLTRLTESGLSIVEWKLVSGILPPLTEESWQREFDAYRQSPQYEKVNKGMTVSDFKNIFWLEYLHRLLGRSIGLVALLPLIWLSAKRKTIFHYDKRNDELNDHPLFQDHRWLLGRMWLVALLIGLQGALGWYMVKSGLIDVPWVSPYRLAAHLGLAVTILLLLVNSLLRLSSITALQRSIAAQRFSIAVVAVVFVQIILGAFVAGLDAGLTYNTFPLMDGDFIPSGLWQMDPAWRNIFENVTTVNFFHRWFAFVAGGFVLSQSFWIIKTTPSSFLVKCAYASAGLVILQIVLGISTLLLVVPVHLATLHQAVAALLLISVNSIAYISWQSKLRIVSHQTTLSMSLST
ncbi:MAG: COX15/CtaA family protein [Rickettsiales bacterium]